MQSQPGHAQKRVLYYYYYYLFLFTVANQVFVPCSVSVSLLPVASVYHGLSSSFRRLIFDKSSTLRETLSLTVLQCAVVDAVPLLKMTRKSPTER